MIFRLCKLRKGGKPPGKGIKPGSVAAGLTDRGTLCVEGTWLGSGTVVAPV